MKPGVADFEGPARRAGILWSARRAMPGEAKGPLETRKPARDKGFRATVTYWGIVAFHAQYADEPHIVRLCRAARFEVKCDINSLIPK
ncbi:hypothetical protein GCM10009078_05200 [Cupriavidus gilardii]